ncbi:Sensor histidine kinase LnrJ [Paenibacillus sp. JJ-100]|uniref:sensor histidine kinase n=1 Tax=Paenibacillus sp. JJ-100 TaxID=2974896 RepID=UPI0022FF6AF3|nr:sensor histidine kinase [Paenibacillus sp. JJ-100]CAI6079870.1 Sensor histidine kinase LnrJ [Paenibacillus sp. JJ-100]
MKRILSFMDWGLLALRFYHYILLASRLVEESEFSILTVVNIIWLILASVVPMLFWFPGRRNNKTWFCILELLLGGSYYVNSAIHPDLTSRADYLLLSLIMGYLMTRKTIWVIPVVAFIPFLSQTYLHLPWEQAFIFASDNLLFCFIGIWASSVAKAYEEKTALALEVERQNKLLTLYTAEIETMTLQEERNRMSKELHDTLGHSFIALIMSLDASIALLDRKPEEVKDRLIRIRALAEQNLDDMRNIVHEMSEEEGASLTQQVENLVLRFQEHTGTVLTVNLLGTEPRVHFEVRQAVIRVIQEAFTNALKHGKASRLYLELEFAVNTLKLIVRNNGIPIQRMDYGFGLTTMKHRIERLGGNLSVDSKEEAEAMTEVRCEIPLKGVLLHAEH